MVTSAWRARWRLLVPAAAGLLILPVGAPEARAEGGGFDAEMAIVREAFEARRAANQRGVEVQKRIDEMSNKTDALYARYTSALSQLASLRSYNQRMRDIVGDQEAELDELRFQLDEVDAVGRSVTPLMLRMIESLESFVEFDVPFLLDERRERLEDLRRMMIRADVTVSEKYRRIMEAYQIENEYGRTIEAYRGELELDGEPQSVDLLRFGRIALMYLTLDEEQGGFWDVEHGAWRPLEGGALADVRHGLRVAHKLVPPDLVRLPLPVPSAPAREG